MVYVSPSAALAVTAQVPIAITAARVIVNAFLFMIYILLKIMFERKKSILLTFVV